MWHTEVYKTCIGKQDSKKEAFTTDEIYEEWMLVKEHYGQEVIENHITLHKIRKLDTNQPLRSLSQTEKIIKEAKSKINTFYLIKFLLILYWYFGSMNIIDKFFKVSHEKV